MTDYVGAYTDSKNPYHREALDLAERLRSRATITDGIIRWNSNNCVLFDDAIALARHIGLPVDPIASAQARDIETRQFLAAYRKNSRKPTAEERAEMRAAFGPGKRVVNIITGRVTRT